MHLWSTQLWTVIRWAARIARLILLPKWIVEGRLSKRMALLIGFLLLAIELLPVAHPLKAQTHAVYTRVAVAVAEQWQDGWGARVQAAQALGALDAEIDQGRWAEAEAGALAARQQSRAVAVQAELNQLQSALAQWIAQQPAGTLAMTQRGRVIVNPEAAAAWAQWDQALSTQQAELAHVQRTAELAAAAHQRAQAWRSEAEVSRARLADYLALLNTAPVYTADSGWDSGWGSALANALDAELDRRQRIATERAKLETPPPIE